MLSMLIVKWPLPTPILSARLSSMKLMLKFVHGQTVTLATVSWQSMKSRLIATFGPPELLQSSIMLMTRSLSFLKKVRTAMFRLAPVHRSTPTTITTLTTATCGTYWTVSAAWLTRVSATATLDPMTMQWLVLNTEKS